MAKLTAKRRPLKTKTSKVSVIKQEQCPGTKPENQDPVCSDKAEETHSQTDKEQTIRTSGCKVEYEIEEAQDGKPCPERRKKLIAFIGNLPYRMTEERLR